RLPRRRAAPGHAGGGSGGPAAARSRRARPQDRRAAGAGEPDDGALRGAGRGPGAAVVVDRDVRGRGHRAGSRAGVGDLAGGGMTTTSLRVSAVRQGVRDTAPVVVAYVP